MSEKKKFIRDSVYGDISLNSFEVKIMDMPQFQRLRRIKQLGLISLIYPGATHTRFEHCVGTMNLGSKLSEELGLNKDEIELIRASGLLHDIGHGVNEIVDIINGKGTLGPIVSGELDVDRMDYLLRDSHNTGVSYGKIDYERLISNLRLDDGLILDIKGVQAAEGALVSRYFMYPSVYQHHTTRIVNTMFRRALKKIIDEDIIKEREIYKYDDSDIIATFRQCENDYARDIMYRLDNRIVPKRVKTIRLDNFKFPEKMYKIEADELRKAEAQNTLALTR